MPRSPRRRTVLRPLPGDEAPITERQWSRLVSLSLGERLWPKVRGPWCEGLDVDGVPFAVGEDDCWMFEGGSNAGGWRMKGGKRIKAYDRPGYGRITFSSGAGREKKIGAHVAAYLLVFGPFPDDQEIDHTCSKTLCCNPRHLRAVPHSENVREAWARGERRRRSRTAA